MRCSQGAIALLPVPPNSTSLWPARSVAASVLRSTLLQLRKSVSISASCRLSAFGDFIAPFLPTCPLFLAVSLPLLPTAVYLSVYVHASACGLNLCLSVFCDPCLHFHDRLLKGPEVQAAFWSTTQSISLELFLSRVHCLLPLQPVSEFRTSVCCPKSPITSEVQMMENKVNPRSSCSPYLAALWSKQQENSHPHFKNEETEAVGGAMVCPRSHTNLRATVTRTAILIESPDNILVFFFFN